MRRDIAGERVNRKQINLEKKKKKSRIAIRFSHTFVDRSAIISVTVERQNDGAPRRSIPTGLCPCKSAKHAPVGDDSTGRAICRIALDRKRGDQHRIQPIIASHVPFPINPCCINTDRNYATGVQSGHRPRRRCWLPR